MREPIIVRQATSSGLQLTPIIPAWVLHGAPVAHARSVVQFADRITHVMAWDCTPGCFDWHYGDADEIVYILSGEVFISVAGAPERRAGAGDVVVFPAGSCCTWRVTETVRKFAVLHKHIPWPVAVGVRAWNKLRRPIQRLSRSRVANRASADAMPAMQPGKPPA